MVRKSYTAFAVLAIATMSIIGCGKEDVTDLTNTWTKAESDLNGKLAEVKTTHADIMQKCTMMPMSNSTDTAMANEHQMMMKTLTADETSLGEIDAKVAELKSKREEAEKSGKRADIEAAWNSAKSDYDALNAKLDGIKDNNGKFKSKVDAMAKTNPMSGDTATGAGMKMDKDTAVTHEVKMEGSKMKAEVKKETTSPATSDKKNDKNDKPLIKLNKNP